MLQVRSLKHPCKLFKLCKLLKHRPLKLCMLLKDMFQVRLQLFMLLKKMGASQEDGAAASASAQPGSVHQGCTDRKKRDLAFSMVCHFNQVTQTVDSNTKCEVLLKFFSHPKMEVVVKNTRFPTQDILDLIV